MNKKRGKELTVLRPFRGFFDIFDDDLLDFGLRDLSDRSVFTEAFSPSVEIENKKDKYVVRAEVPGISKDDIKLRLHDNTLTIEGEKKYENRKEEDGYYFSERSYGSFYRTVPLAKNVVTDKAKAKYDKGVIEIELPKDKKAKAGDKEIRID